MINNLLSFLPPRSAGAVDFGGRLLTLKKTRAIALLLLLALLASAVSGCAQKEPEVYPNAAAPTAIKQGGLLETARPTDPPAEPQSADELDYDPLAEEDDALQGYYAQSEYNEYGQAVYAGTTPIPLDPVDKPTPTPKPELSFTYVAQTAAALGLSFEGPTDWMLTAEGSTTYTLTDPTTRDNVNASITISVAPVANNYKSTDITGDLKSYLLNLQKSYTVWRTENAAKRTLMGEAGYYNIYRGELYDGTTVRGLVHIALVNGRTITVHLQCPAGFYQNSYVKVYTKLRNTLKAL